MIYIEKENYRIASMCKLDVDDVGTRIINVGMEDGLAIEKRCEDKTSWYIICYIIFDEHTGTYCMDCIGNRLTDVPACDWEIVKELIFAAGALVTIANKEDPEIEEFQYEN